MNAPTYTDEEFDALREIANVAMGQAACSLASVLDRFVRLPIPRLRIVDTGCVVDTIREMVGDEPLTAVRQAFYGRAFGEVISVFDDRSFQEISELLGHDQPGSEEEQLLDVSNILIGACVQGIADQLDCAVSYSPPSLIVRGGSIEDVLRNESSWQNALLIEVNFRLEGRSFVSHVLAFWPDAALSEIHAAVGRFLEEI